MLSQSAGLAVTFVTLGAFAWLAVRGAARFDIRDRDQYLTARGSQAGPTVTLTFFASVMGAWILFAPPEVGTFGGLLGMLGYALGQGVAIAIFAWLGPALRHRMPAGTTILEFVGLRFGRIQQLYVAGISVLYMFVFLAAELTAVGGVIGLITGAGPVVPVVAVAAVTAAYTAYGGLPASISTDRWQGGLIVALAIVAGIAIGIDVDTPGTRASQGGIGDITRVGAETFVVLVIAITAANMFHQGFWQRVWSARSDRSLARGALGAGVLIVPVVFLMGATGAIASARGVEVPSLAFFSLLEGLPDAVLAVVLVLGVSLVASSVDTLQNALTSLADFHLRRGKVNVVGDGSERHGPKEPQSGSIGTARAVTVALTVPAAAIAVQEVSVLRLFLIADLLAATIVLPVFMGLWARARAPAALLGSIAGVVSVVVLGAVSKGSLGEGLSLLTLPEGASFGAFVIAPLASGAVTVAVSLLPAHRVVKEADISASVTTR